MYESFFGLKESPFNITPDPRFIYLSRHHLEALSNLLYGIESRRGFIEITGEVGAGKTTLCRTLLQETQGRVHSAFIFNPKLSEVELLQGIVEDFGITPKGKRRKDYFDALNRFLLQELEKGMNATLIIDEAQNLSPRALEQIRLLSNLETTREKLLQIVLVGQPELHDLLARPDLKQLRQRIVVRYHLRALDQEDTAKYIAHRLRVAGSEDQFFTPEAIERIYALSEGVPRIINVLADRALLGAFIKEFRIVEAAQIEEAQSDLEGVRV
ncbi:MAG: AAA family ATPase [Candidatus Omnitrophica bacterium]|nr:AAA family ATPase [Candidatus Omnitrophota bacterium]